MIKEMTGVSPPDTTTVSNTNVDCLLFKAFGNEMQFNEVCQ